MKKTAIAALAMTSLAGSAFAADMAARPVYKAPPPAPAFSWTGCYLGAGGGGGMWNQEVTTVTTATGAALSGRETMGGRGWFGTVQGGCDYQFASPIPLFSNNMVFGVFADYDFGSLKGDFNEPNFALLGDEKMRWSWAVGARLGWTPVDRLLAYVSGGFTQAHFNQIDLHTTAAGGGAVTDFIPAHTYDGWFVGTGYEYAIGWLPGLTWKTEYRFADYGKDRLDDFLVGGAASGRSIDSEKFVHTVRSELVWRFNWWR